MITLPSPTVRFWSRAVYVLLAAAVVAGLGLKVHWDRMYGAAQRHYQQSRQQYEQQAKQRHQHIRKQFHDVMYTDTPVTEVQRLVGGQLQVTSSTDSSTQRTDYALVDTQYNTLLTLSYNAEGVVDAGSLGGAGSGGTKFVRPIRRSIEDKIQQLGRLLCPVVGNMFTPVVVLPWLVVLVLTRFMVAWRPLLYAGAWCVVILSGLVWLMSPAFPLTSLRSVMSNDPLSWSLLMSVATAITWAVQRVNHKIDPNLCLGCGYNLTANTTGQCPECGSTIPNDQQEHLRGMA